MRETENKKKMKGNERGITLIALVITIIVLLLLAGVAISMLTGENGIINKTNSAKSESVVAEEEEQVKLAVMAALIAGNGKITSGESIDTLKEELIKAGFENINEINTLPATIVTENNVFCLDENGNIGSLPSIEECIDEDKVFDNKTTVMDNKKKTMVIPESFKIADDSATDIKDGVVVVAPDGSEFVWIPVDDINSMVMCSSHTGTSDCSISKDDAGDLICTNHNNNFICGKLYEDATGEEFDSSLNTQQYKVNEGMREPDVLQDTQYGDYSTTSGRGINLLKSIIGLSGTNDQIKNAWNDELQKSFKAMAKSVYENKGFYVGRYETSLDENNKAQSKANVVSASAETDSGNTWYGLYKIEKDYSSKEYESGKSLSSIVGSSMIWGCQYDQIMLWMLANGIDVTSTEASKLQGATQNRLRKYITGYNDDVYGVDNDKINNIYDLLGCRHEWTLTGLGSFARVHRGGAYSATSSTMYSPSYNYNCKPYDYTYGSGPVSRGSRMTLYIN